MHPGSHISVRLLEFPETLDIRLLILSAHLFYCMKSDLALYVQQTLYKHRNRTDHRLFHGNTDRHRLTLKMLHCNKTITNTTLQPE